MWLSCYGCEAFAVLQGCDDGVCLYRLFPVGETHCFLYMKHIVSCTCHTLFPVHVTGCFMCMSQVVSCACHRLFHVHITLCDMYISVAGVCGFAVCFPAWPCKGSLAGRRATRKRHGKEALRLFPCRYVSLITGVILWSRCRWFGAVRQSCDSFSLPSLLLSGLQRPGRM